MKNTKLINHVNSSKKVEFGDMSLHTLANLYLDCFDDYKIRKFSSDQSANILKNNIFIYIQSRQDETRFFELVETNNKIR